MRSRRSLILCGFALVALLASSASAQQESFQAFLLGTGENPPNASPATGFGTVLLNAAHTLITVDENWSGLTAPATASHIHGPAGPGTNAAVLFPFSGVPAATSGAIPEQSFAITAAQVTQLESGLFYINVHTSTFPGGEIRAQLLPVPVPEPSSVFLLALGGAGLVWQYWARRRR